MNGLGNSHVCLGSSLAADRLWMESKSMRWGIEVNGAGALTQASTHCAVWLSEQIGHHGQMWGLTQGCVSMVVTLRLRGEDLSGWGASGLRGWPVYAGLACVCCATYASVRC